MKRTGKMLAMLLAMLMLLSACGNTDAAVSGNAAGADTSAAAFEPALDTQKAVEMDVAVFFGNFEAFDQVINHFNEIYPNVQITYTQVSGSGLNEYLAENPTVDIFMTSTTAGYPQESCVDLLSAGVDVSAVSDELLLSNTVDGKLLSLPMGLIYSGMVVNKTLLKDEGLEVPETWQELLEVLDALKAKGYTPIQGPDSAVSTLCYNMGMTMLSNDTDLLNAVTSGDAEGAAAMRTVYERLLELQSKGYFSADVDAEYPEDNYDGAILKFFEGDVPFWVCNTEKVSGMKKRESKSETYSATPFDYEFILPPLGENGVYKFVEPWYGFAVNQGADEKDYAVEFLRFMAQADELNTLASVKGVPSVAKDAADERYTGLDTVEQVEDSAVYNGIPYSYVGTYMLSTANDLLNGTLPDADAAVEHFVSSCAETAQNMENGN